MLEAGLRSSKYPDDERKVELTGLRSASLTNGKKKKLARFNWAILLTFAILLSVAANTNGCPAVRNSLRTMRQRLMNALNWIICSSEGCLWTGDFVRRVYPDKGVDIGGLMSSGKPALVTFSVGSNVLLVPQAKLFNCLLYDFIPSITSHGLGADSHGQK